MFHQNAAMSSHKKRRSSRFHVALSALVLTAAARTATAQEEEIYYEPRSATIYDGLVNKPVDVCPVSYGGIEASKTFPWTHNPTCVDVTTDGARRRFCAYTNAGYNNGRGISFVVSPEVAASVTMGTFGVGIGGLEGQIGQEMGMWEVRDAGVKGKGLFARKDVGAIFAGESLILQTPLLFVAKDALEESNVAETRRVLQTAVQQLPEKSRTLIKELSWNKDGSAEDIVTTNGIGVKWPWVDEIPELLSVTPEIARINHACRPNTLWRFNDFTLAFDVFALREIKPGEEITRSYGYEKRPHRRRVLSLEANCGFTCACPLCTASDEEIMASNDRLSEIKALKSVMPKDETDAPEFLRLLPSLIKNLEEEGLIAELPSYEETLAYTWSMFGKEDEASYWAGRAQKHWAVIAGKESWEQRRCGDMEKDVKSHKTWKSWKGEPLDGQKEEEEEEEDEDEYED